MSEDEIIQAIARQIPDDHPAGWPPDVIALHIWGEIRQREPRITEKTQFRVNAPYPLRIPETPPRETLGESVPFQKAAMQWGSDIPPVIVRWAYLPWNDTVVIRERAKEERDS